MYAMARVAKLLANTLPIKIEYARFRVSEYSLFVLHLTPFIVYDAICNEHLFPLTF